jgi:hypothetical protein
MILTCECGRAGYCSTKACGGQTGHGCAVRLGIRTLTGRQKQAAPSAHGVVGARLLTAKGAVCRMSTMQTGGHCASLPMTSACWERWFVYHGGNGVDAYFARFVIVGMLQAAQDERVRDCRLRQVHIE